MTPLGQPPCLCGASIPRRFADDNSDNISNGHDNLSQIAVFRARWRAGYVDICACAGCGRRIAESRSRSARSVCLAEGCHQEGHQQSCPGEGTPDINTPSLSSLLNIPILILITLPHPHIHIHNQLQPTTNPQQLSQSRHHGLLHRHRPRLRRHRHHRRQRRPLPLPLRQLRLGLGQLRYFPSHVPTPEHLTDTSQATPTTSSRPQPTPPTVARSTTPSTVATR